MNTKNKDKVSIYFANTQYGFEWGSAKIKRLFSAHDESEWVTLGLETPKYKEQAAIQIYVTKSGKVRIFDSNGEWTKPEGA